MLIKYKNVLSALAFTLLLAPAANARISPEESNKQLFGETYRAVSAPPKDRAKIIYYWNGQDSQQRGTNIYINEHFHTALHAGGFTVFCLRPGTYNLGAYQYDAPLYQASSETHQQVKFSAGQTYFVKVIDKNVSAPISVIRTVAEKELSGLRLQKHAISRSPIISCDK